MPRQGLLIFAIVVAQSQANPIAPYDQLNWTPRDQLPAEMQQSLPSFCSGTYLPESLQFSHSGAMEIESDQGEFIEKQGATFEGNVLLKMNGQQIQADSASYHQDTGKAQFAGNIRLHSQDIALATKQMDYDTQSAHASIQQAHYVIAPLHLRGKAGNIELLGENQLNLFDASYTYCEPGHNDWDIAASELLLNQQKGYGEAWHGRLRIKEVPVMYLPYYRFPLGPDRLTGFLNPELSLDVRSPKGDISKTEIAVKQFALPFYINIAPNYDDTYTPRLVYNHGIIHENEFRYLNGLGEGEFAVSYLADDKSNDRDELTDEDYRQQERWSRSLHHSGEFSTNVKNRIHYEEVSDTHFEDDFNRSGLINRTSHLKQNAEVEFNNGTWQALTRVEQYQTIDENIADSSRPYSRLPQVELTRLNTFEYNTLNYDATVQATRFTRDHDGISGQNLIDGERLHTQVSISYPWQQAYGFLTPKVEAQYTQYSFQNVSDALITSGYEKEVTRTATISSLDGGLFFERNFQFMDSSFVQTLEPRIMLAYIPYVDQSNIPLFDTTQTTFSYSQLFQANRFTGVDRVGDTQQMSVGLTTRFLDGSGLEVVRASIGQIHYFSDRQVQLALSGTQAEVLGDEYTKSSSSLAGEFQWLFAPNWRTRLDMQYNPHAQSDEEPIEKGSMLLNYQSPSSWLFDMSFSHVESSSQKQLGMAFFAPLNDSWAIYTQKKHDLWPYEAADKQLKEEENLLNIEGLLGIEYQNCCWRAQLTYEEHTRSDSTKDYQFMFQLHLKGLGILGSKSDDILSERILGYDQRQFHDY
ncbi:LPS-assembly protein LptD [Oceaniserpentilla sp. 4NH20-0058]|uniref:LPS-assembly protein LptD n=1 Tax=Oceaniserpentilla sp. 4NH20-0058 TaxID=3127660 RepID=UPI00310618D7